MNNIREITNKYAIIPQRYTIKKNATIIDADDGHFVFKKRNGLFWSLNENELLFADKNETKPSENQVLFQGSMFIQC